MYVSGEQSNKAIERKQDKVGELVL